MANGTQTARIGEDEHGFYIRTTDFSDSGDFQGSQEVSEGIPTIEEARKQLSELASMDTEEGFYTVEWDADADGYTRRRTDKSFEEGMGVEN